MFDFFAEVCVRLPVAGSFTYRLPADANARAGMRVEVPFRGKKQEGIIVDLHRNEPEFRVLPIERVIDSEPVLNEEQLELSNWLSEVCVAARGECLFKMVPIGRRYPAQESREYTVKRPAHDLNDEQQDVYQSVLPEIQNSQPRKPAVHLIHGITGSGKTEVYIHLILAALAAGRSALLLVPEITLTVQLIERLKSVFGDNLALLHSALTGSARFSAYIRLQRGERRIAVGTRSAVFAPMHNLGVIILDEEHDGSYKEHSTPRYDARQVAYYRARSHGAPIVLGSATPRLETAYLARARSKESGYHYHTIQARATGASLPRVEIVDAGPSDVPLSGAIVNEIDWNHRNGQQSLLLLNRRGYNTSVYCDSCQLAEACPSCSVALNLHRDGRLVCHYCGYTRSFTGGCSRCGSKLKRLGSGTQKLEEYLLGLFPKLKLERLDTDVATKRGMIEAAIGRLLGGETDLLIGTQMIAKGLDAPRVTFVGVLQADAGLYMPDFRASERTFALLTQVAGRAGRGDWQGRVYFEALNADHPLLACAARQDYESFYRQEILDRRDAIYPPFCRLARLLFRSTEEGRAANAAEKLRRQLETALAGLSEVTILGPAPAPIERLHDQYRYHILLKVPALGKLRGLISQILAETRAGLGADLYLEVDFDPIDLF